MPIGKNDSKERTGRIESTCDESIPRMLSSLFCFSEEESDSERAKCLELHND